MNYKDVVNQFNQKKVKDYTFTVLFFIVFSIFVVFAIRPNILTAFELRNELVELKKKDEEYEQLIQQIVEHQTILESQRNNLYVLDEAVPQKYLLHYQIIDDIMSSATDSAVIVNDLSIPEVKLVTKSKDVGFKEIPVTVNVRTEQPNLTAFLKTFLQQRRLKQLTEMTMEMDESEASDSANWRTGIKINSFYYKL